MGFQLVGIHRLDRYVHFRFRLGKGAETLIRRSPARQRMNQRQLDRTLCVVGEHVSKVLSMWSDRRFRSLGKVLLSMDRLFRGNG